MLPVIQDLRVLDGCKEIRLKLRLGQEPSQIPVSYRIRYNATPARELPTRFLQSVTLDTRDFATGTFTGTIERQEGTP